MTESSLEISRLVGVYAADGTVIGEVKYWIGARLGRTHCSLCDITHGSVRERADWKACRSALPVAFDTYHRDDQPATVRAAAGDVTPVVVAETSDGVVVLLGPDDLEACAGSPDRLIDAVTEAIGRSGLRLPTDG